MSKVPEQNPKKKLKLKYLINYTSYFSINRCKNNNQFVYLHNKIINVINSCYINDLIYKAMTTIQLKKVLIHQIAKIEDISFLNALFAKS